MIGLLLALALSQPGECNDRSPGLSQCVEYEALDGGGVSCRAACYWGRRPDGGTYGNVVRATGPSEPACLLELKRQASNRCQPVQSRK